MKRGFKRRKIGFHSRRSHQDRCLDLGISAAMKERSYDVVERFSFSGDLKDVSRHLALNERKQRHNARALDRKRQFALVKCAHATAFARHHFGKRRGIAAQRAGILVINHLRFVHAEETVALCFLVRFFHKGRRLKS